MKQGGIQRRKRSALLLQRGNRYSSQKDALLVGGSTNQTQTQTQSPEKRIPATNSSQKRRTKRVHGNKEQAKMHKILNGTAALPIKSTKSSLATRHNQQITMHQTSASLQNLNSNSNSSAMFKKQSNANKTNNFSHNLQNPNQQVYKNTQFLHENSSTLLIQSNVKGAETNSIKRTNEGLLQSDDIDLKRVIAEHPVQDNGSTLSNFMAGGYQLSNQNTILSKDFAQVTNLNSQAKMIFGDADDKESLNAIPFAPSIFSEQNKKEPFKQDIVTQKKVDTYQGPSYTKVYVLGDTSLGQLGFQSQKPAKNQQNSNEPPQQEINNLFERPKMCSYNIVIKQIACGETHTHILSQDGYVYSMGQNRCGVLGLGLSEDSLACSYQPQLISALTDVIQISAGKCHSLALANSKNGRQVYGWGKIENGAIGVVDDDTVNPTAFSPVIIDLPTQREKEKDMVVQVEAGMEHSVFLTGLGEVYGCGGGEFGQLGLGYTPVSEYRPTRLTLKEISEGDYVTQISCGAFHTCFLTRYKRVYACGLNDLGQLGIELVDEKQVNIPVPVNYLDNKQIREIQCGKCSFALNTSGQLFVWGLYNNQIYRQPFTPCTVTRPLAHIKQSLTGITAAVDIDHKAWLWDTTQLEDKESASVSGENKSTSLLKLHPYPTLLRQLRHKHVNQAFVGNNLLFCLGEDILQTKLPSLQSFPDQMQSQSMFQQQLQPPETDYQQQTDVHSDNKGPPGFNSNDQQIQTKSQKRQSSGTSKGHFGVNRSSIRSKKNMPKLDFSKLNGISASKSTDKLFPKKTASSVPQFGGKSNPVKPSQSRCQNETQNGQKRAQHHDKSQNRSSISNNYRSPQPISRHSKSKSRQSVSAYSQSRKSGAKISNNTHQKRRNNQSHSKSVKTQQSCPSGSYSRSRSKNTRKSRPFANRKESQKEPAKHLQADNSNDYNISNQKLSPIRGAKRQSDPNLLSVEKKFAEINKKIDDDKQNFGRRIHKNRVRSRESRNQSGSKRKKTGSQKRKQLQTNGQRLNLAQQMMVTPSTENVNYLNGSIIKNEADDSNAILTPQTDIDQVYQHQTNKFLSIIDDEVSKKFASDEIIEPAGMNQEEQIAFLQNQVTILREERDQQSLKSTTYKQKYQALKKKRAVERNESRLSAANYEEQMLLARNASTDFQIRYSDAERRVKDLEEAVISLQVAKNKEQGYLKKLGENHEQLRIEKARNRDLHGQLDMIQRTMAILEATLEQTRKDKSRLLMDLLAYRKRYGANEGGSLSGDNSQILVDDQQKRRTDQLIQPQFNNLDFINSQQRIGTNKSQQDERHNYPPMNGRNPRNFKESLSSEGVEAQQPHNRTMDNNEETGPAKRCKSYKSDGTSLLEQMIDKSVDSGNQKLPNSRKNNSSHHQHANSRNNVRAVSSHTNGSRRRTKEIKLFSDNDLEEDKRKEYLHRHMSPQNRQTANLTQHQPSTLIGASLKQMSLPVQKRENINKDLCVEKIQGGQDTQHTGRFQDNHPLRQQLSPSRQICSLQDQINESNSHPAHMGSLDQRVEDLRELTIKERAQIQEHNQRVLQRSLQNSLQKKEPMYVNRSCSPLRPQGPQSQNPTEIKQKSASEVMSRDSYRQDQKTIKKSDRKAFQKRKESSSPVRKPHENKDERQSYSPLRNFNKNGQMIESPRSNSSKQNKRLSVSSHGPRTRLSQFPLRQSVPAPIIPDYLQNPSILENQSIQCDSPQPVRQADPDPDFLRQRARSSIRGDSQQHIGPPLSSKREPPSPQTYRKPNFRDLRPESSLTPEVPQQFNRKMVPEKHPKNDFSHSLHAPQLIENLNTSPFSQPPLQSNAALQYYPHHNHNHMLRNPKNVVPQQADDKRTHHDQLVKDRESLRETYNELMQNKLDKITEDTLKKASVPSRQSRDNPVTEYTNRDNNQPANSNVGGRTDHAEESRSQNSNSLPRSHNLYKNEDYRKVQDQLRSLERSQSPVDFRSNSRSKSRQKGLDKAAKKHEKAPGDEDQDDTINKLLVQNKASNKNLRKEGNPAANGLTSPQREKQTPENNSFLARRQALQNRLKNI